MNSSVSTTTRKLLKKYSQNDSSVLFEFSLYLEQSMIDLFENLFLNQFKRLFNDYDEDLIRISFKKCDFVEHFRGSSAYTSYSFDQEFIGNLLDNHTNLIKYQFTLISSRNNDDDYEKFEEIQAIIRAKLSQISKPLSLINDNFLNFTSSFHFKPIDSWEKLNELANDSCQVQKLFNCCFERLKNLDFNPQRWCLSFNGGKDCTVLLHVLATIHHHYYLSNHHSKCLKDSLPINLLWIKTSELFPEQQLFMKRIEKYYHCKINIYEGKDMKSALFKVRDNEKFAEIFMGCRRTDFDEKIARKMTVIQSTDEGWPKFIRINPLLDWNYHDVWNFLLKLNVPYCPLYNYGYTSIDKPENTCPNPSLLLKNFRNKQNNDATSDENARQTRIDNLDHYNNNDNENNCKQIEAISNDKIDQIDCNDHEYGNKIYLPAYLLRQDEMERCSRH